MAEKEKQIAKTLADAVATLPEEKKEYFIGFAEGAAAMAGLKSETEATRQNGTN